MKDDDTNGHGSEEEYQTLLKELESEGVITEGASGGIPLLSQPTARTSNAALLASVPNIERYYDKDKDKALLLDLISRTSFRNDREFKQFLKFVDWCEDFRDDPNRFDGCLRYLSGINSVGGKSREQYTAAITTWRLQHNYANKQSDKDRVKSEYREGKLS